jgi:hypothetical protein
MKTACIFCDNDSGSREHLWPKWIHEILDVGPIRFQLGNRPEKLLENAEIKVGTVCNECNGGWMSTLESDNIPHMKPMILGTSTTLNEHQQHLICEWGVKTSMVSDSMKGRKAPNRFYRKEECIALKEANEIPSRSMIWIGGLDEPNHLNNSGTDFSLMGQDGSKIARASVSTFVAGHFAIQILTVHPIEGHTAQIQVPSKPGDWDNMLIPVWPIQSPTVAWPPKVSFTNGGLLGIAHLMDRLRLGEKVDFVV